MLKVGEDQRFGPYMISMESEGHAVIWPADLDGSPVNPTWYELQHMKALAFGAQACAVEVFPPTRKLVDGQNQRHLWLVDYEAIPHFQKDEEAGADPLAHTEEETDHAAHL